MRAFLEFIVRGRTPAVLIAAGFAGVSLIPLLWPFGVYLSGAVVGLVTLRYGYSQGFVVLAGVSVLFGAFATLLVSTMLEAREGLSAYMAWLVVVMLPLCWVWTWVMGGVLRSANSQGYALLVGAVAAIGAIVLFALFVPDSGTWWSEPVAAFVKSLEAPGLAGDPDAVEQVSDLLASVMTGVMVASVVFNAILMLLISRWWHAILDNPGGFGREFRALRLDRRISVAAIALLLLVPYAGDAVATFGLEVLGVAGVLYVFQGLALIHALVSITGAWTGWLVLMYVLVFALPQLLFVLATTGFLDSWIDFRKRVRSRTT